MKKSKNKQKKKLPIWLKALICVVSIIVGVFALLLGVYLFTGNLDEEIEPVEEEVEEKVVQAGPSEYTDIELASYGGLTMSTTPTEEYPVVRYERVMKEDDMETLTIVNKNYLEGDDVKAFEEAAEDIKEGNMDARWLLVDSAPPVMSDSISPPVFDPIIKIEDIEYRETDHVFAVLSLSHGHEFAAADDTSPNYQIFVFALSGDNMLRLESQRKNLIEEIRLSEVDSENCTKKDDIFGEFTTYDVECLRAVFESGAYDKMIEREAEFLVRSFRIMR